MAHACRHWAIITGASSGIGAALAVRLSTLNYNVLAIGRREERLVETKLAGKSDNIFTLKNDIGDSTTWNQIVKFVPDDSQNKIKFLIHNAAVGDPAHLDEIDLDHWNYAMMVNVTAPLFLTQKLLNRLDENHGRILHLGTGVAFKPQIGTATYGVTKMAFHRYIHYRLTTLQALIVVFVCDSRRLFQQIKVDLEGSERYKNVRIGSVSPGVVRTEGVYDHYDKAKAIGCPHVAYFDSVFQANNDISMDRCVDFIVNLLTNTSDDVFSKQEWSTSSKL